MKKRTIIIAGSEGLIGKTMSRFFQECENTELIKLDLSLGHDLTQESQVKTMLDQHKEADYLVNLFAINDHVDKNKNSSDPLDISLDSLRTYCEVNLVSLFSMCRTFIKNRNGRPGGIVNFSSLYGIRSPKHPIYSDSSKHIGYCMTKAGVVGMSQYLATLTAKQNLRVNCVVPGGVIHEQGSDFLEQYNKHSPIGRMMRPEELNGIVDYLCSDASSYTTAAVIPVDGGWTAW